MKNKKVTIEDLAVMTQNGFQAVEQRFDKLEKRFDILEQGHEEIKLQLDNVAYRFELVELQRRVETLEKKLGVKVG